MTGPIGRIALLLASTTGVVVAPLAAQHREPRPPSGGPGFLFRMPRVSVGVRGGFNLRRANAGPDDFYDFVTRELTLGRSDFNALSVGADLDVVFDGPTDIVFSAGHSFTGASSEFRDWVDQNDQPITQRTTLATTAFTMAVRVNLASRGRRIGQFVWMPNRVLPYVGLGGGAIKYSLLQDGYFVDAQDLSIFRDQLMSRGWAPMALVMAGVDYSIGLRFVANAEAHYQLAKGKLRYDYVNFRDGIDLNGLQFSMGLRVRI